MGVIRSMSGRVKAPVDAVFDLRLVSARHGESLSS